MLDHGERDERLEHRHFDRLAPAGFLALIKRREHRAHHAIRPGLVGQHGRHEMRLVRHDRLQHGDAASGLDDVVIGGLGAHRPLGAEAVGRKVDQPRIGPGEYFVGDTEPGRRFGAEIMHQHVGARGKPKQCIPAERFFEIEHEAALVAVAAEEERGHALVPSRPELAGGVALRRFDLHDIGTEVAEVLRRIGPEHHRAAIENFYARQRSRHDLLPADHALLRASGVGWQARFQNDSAGGNRAGRAVSCERGFELH